MNFFWIKENSGSLETVAHKLMISQTQVISHDLFMIYDLVTHYPNMQNDMLLMLALTLAIIDAFTAKVK